MSQKLLCRLAGKRSRLFLNHFDYLSAHRVVVCGAGEHPIVCMQISILTH